MGESFVLDKNSEYAKYRRKHSILSFLFSPLFFIVFFLIIEVLLIVLFLDVFHSPKLQIAINIINICEILYIVNSKKMKDSFKITWMIIFILMPIFGVVIYFLFQIMAFLNGRRARLRDIVIQSKKFLDYSYSNSIKDKINDHEMIKNIANNNVREQLINEYSFFNYFYNHAKIPNYINTNVKYFDNGKDAFEDIITNLKKAKRFIFIEIFILSDGIVWREILNVLKEKASEGVEVKLLVDGLNSISGVNKRFCRELEEYNIECKIFKPLSPKLSNSQNNRDHRKIFVIDNMIAYTGGINIADEYANLYERFGYWKDTSIRVIGDAVSSFTVMFLQLWQVTSKSRVLEFEKYLNNKSEIECSSVENSMYVPYTDYPNMSENISLQIYKYMFNTANKYMYIMTPYLVIDEALVDVIESAAKRGVDIRIIVPRIPDKKYVFYVNRSYYKSLTLAGAKVYEFMPGFIHAKVYLQDDIRAVVGTANLDYRSLYLHYENGLYLFGDETALNDIKADFDKTLASSKEMNLQEIIKMPIRYRLFGAILRIFAPFM